MVSEQGAFWKTVLPKCHGFRTLTGSILKNSTPKMPWFANRDDSGPIVKCVICPSLALLAKDSIQLRNRQNQCIMLKFHLFPRDSSKDAVLGPAKLPSGLELRSAALGQFCRPLDGIFSRVPRKKVEFWPISYHMLSKWIFSPLTPVIEIQFEMLGWKVFEKCQYSPSGVSGFGFLV